MTNQPATVSSEWFPPQRMKAALYLGSGHTQQQSADAVGVDIRTVQRWLQQDDEFNALVAMFAQQSRERAEPKVMRNLERSLDIQLEVLNGEMDANDRRYAIAHGFINRFLDRAFYVQPAANEGGHTQPPVAVQFNVNGERQRAIE